VAALTQTFGGTISDITGALINKGYARSSEYGADQAAVTLLRRVGYDPNGLTEMLAVMTKNLKAGGLDFAKTHPAPQDRIAEIKKQGLAYAAVPAPAPRQKRFLRAFGNI